MSHELLTHVSLDAPVEQVSAVLRDAPGWRRWSRALWFEADALRVGATVRMRVRARGRTIVLPVRVETCSETSLSWSGGPRRLFRGTHWFRLQTAGESGDRTELEHGERFVGLCTPALVPVLDSTLIELYETINHDLREELARCRQD